MTLEDRLNWADKRLDRMLSQEEKAIIREYRLALRRIHAELAPIYASFPQTTQQRNRQRYLRQLQVQIEQIIAEMYAKNQPRVIGTLGEAYKESYYMTGWAIDMEVDDAQLVWGILNPDVVRRAVLAPIDKLTLNDRLKRNRNLIIKSIRHHLAQGIIMGESYSKMAKRIEKVLEGDAKKARLIMRTEGHRVRNQGRFDSAMKAEELGVESLKVWDATLDLRTRPAHGMLDGTKIAIDEDFVSLNGGIGKHPGGMGNPRDDCNCRCTIRLELPGYGPSVRRIRGEGIKPYITYREWIKKQQKEQEANK